MAGAATRATTPRSTTPARRDSARALAACRQQIAWLRTQIQDVDTNLADLVRTANRIGDASDWRDPRLSALDETISFWRNRYRGLCNQRRDAQARLISLQAVAQRL